MASANDKFLQVGYATATTLSAPGYTISDTAINVGSTTNWPTATGVIFGIDNVTIVDGEEVRTAGSYCVFAGTVASATSINNLTLLSGTPQNYSAGALTRVYITISAEHTNRLVEGLTTAVFDQDGTMKAGAVDVTAVIADGIVTRAKLATAAQTELNTGWNVGALPAVSSVTQNGNHSQDVTFASTVANILTPGMRVRASRTVAAPTQCTDLESGSSQYYSKTTPAGLAGITSVFTAMGWVKLESYATGGIISRIDANDGWDLRVDASGRVQVTGRTTAAGTDSAITYQSLPLNKWVHVAGAFTISSAANTKIYIDGVEAPSAFTDGADAAIGVPAVALEVGAIAGASFFDGKIAQAAVFSAVLTAATIRSYMSQGLSGSETSLISAYSFDNAITDLNTSNANNLTPQGSALATNADSPFALDANGVAGGTYEWGIVTKVVTTTTTIQTPEGNAIPTSGGVSAVSYSTQKAPYGFISDKGKWSVSSLFLVQVATTSNTTYGAYNAGGDKITVPVGAWDFGPDMSLFNSSTTSVEFALANIDPTGNSAGSTWPRTGPTDLTQVYRVQASAAANYFNWVSARESINLTSATAFILYSIGATTAGGIDSDDQLHQFIAECAYL